MSRNRQKGTPPGAAVAFYASAKEARGSTCVEWPYAKSNGYPVMSRGGKRVYAHRQMCTDTHGPPPTPLHQAAHACGNASCVNPGHLRWATREENMADAIEHGTLQRGERHWNARLSNNQVARVRELVASGWTQQRTASLIGCSQATVSNIVNGRRRAAS